MITSRATLTRRPQDQPPVAEFRQRQDPAARTTRLKKSPSLTAALLITLAAILLSAAAAQAQYTYYPRLGASAAPDSHVPEISVHGDEPFVVYIVALPPENEAFHHVSYRSFHWALFEACCGGGADVLSEDFSPECQSEGGTLSGVVSTFDECQGGEAIVLASLTLRMTAPASGSYAIYAGPLGQAMTCDLEPVTMTDLVFYVHFTSDITPVETDTWSGVKRLFR